MASVQVERFHRRLTNLQSHHEYSIKRHLTATDNYVNSNRTLMDSLICHLSEGDKKCKKAKRLAKPRSTNSHVPKISRYGDNGTNLLDFTSRNTSGTICSDDISGGYAYGSNVNHDNGNFERMFELNPLNQPYFSATEPIFPPPVFGEQNLMPGSTFSHHISPDTDSWTMYDRHPFDLPHYENIATDYTVPGYPAPSFYYGNGGVPNLCRSSSIFHGDAGRLSQPTSQLQTSFPERSAFQSEYGSFWYRHPESDPEPGLHGSQQSRREQSQTGIRELRAAGKSSGPCNFLPGNHDLPVFPHITSPSSLAGINPILVSTYVSTPNNSRPCGKFPTGYRQDACRPTGTTGYGFLPPDAAVAMPPSPFENM